MFTTQSEHDLFNYRQTCKNELLKFIENTEMDVDTKNLYVNLINLFYVNQLRSSFYNYNIEKYLSSENIDQLLDIFIEKFNELYFDGSYYEKYETSWYGYPLVVLKKSNIIKMQRIFSYYTKMGIALKRNEILKIILTDLKNDFFGTDGKPTNARQQFEILNKKIVIKQTMQHLT